LDLLYRFDFPMWVLMRTAPGIMHRLVAVPASLVRSLMPGDKARLDEAVKMIPARLIPHAKLIEFPTGGHLLLGRSREVWPAVATFLRREVEGPFARSARTRTAQGQKPSLASA
jgi:hypothetical protein